jgi:hypothetical protein
MSDHKGPADGPPRAGNLDDMFSQDEDIRMDGQGKKLSYAQLESALQSSERALATCRTQVNTSQAVVQTQQNDAKQMRSEYTSLQGDLRKLKNKVTQATSQYDFLKASAETDATLKAIAEDRAQELVVQLAAASAGTQLSDEDLHKLRADLARLKADTQGLEPAPAGTEDTTAMAAENDKYKKQVSEMELLLIAARDERQSWFNKYTESEQALETITAERDNMLTMLASAKSEKEVLESRYKELSTDFTAQENTLTGVEAANDDLQTRLTGALETADGLRTRVEDLEAASAGGQAEEDIALIRELRQEIEDLQNEAVDAKANITALNQAATNIKRLEARVDELESDLKDSIKDKRDMEDLVEDTKKQAIQDKITLVAAHGAALRPMQSKIDDLIQDNAKFVNIETESKHFKKQFEDAKAEGILLDNKVKDLENKLTGMMGIQVQTIDPIDTNIAALRAEIANIPASSNFQVKHAVLAKLADLSTAIDRSTFKTVMQPNHGLTADQMLLIVNKGEAYMQDHSGLCAALHLIHFEYTSAATPPSAATLQTSATAPTSTAAPAAAPLTSVQQALMSQALGTAPALQVYNFTQPPPPIIQATPAPSAGFASSANAQPLNSSGISALPRVGLNQRHEPIPWYARPGEEGEDYYTKEVPQMWRLKPDASNLQTPGDMARLLSSKLVPQFSGNMHEYPAFRSRFVHHIHKANVSILVKHSALAQCLDKVPNAIMSLSDPGKGGYLLGIKKVERIFGGVERMLNYYYDIVEGIKIVRSNSIDDLEALVDAVEHYHNILPTGRASEIKTHSYAHQLIKKLDDKLKEQYFNHCRTLGLGSFYDAEELIKWMKDFPMEYLREMTASDILPAQEAEPKNWNIEKAKDYNWAKSKVHMVVRSPNTCIFCKEALHSWTKCAVFAKYNPTMRRYMCAGFQVCRVCLEPGHFARDCKVKEVCSTCKGQHHSLLHGAYIYNNKTAQFKKRTNLTLEGEGNSGPSDEELAALATMPPEELAELEREMLEEQDEQSRRCNYTSMRSEQDELMEAQLSQEEEGKKTFMGNSDPWHSIRFITVNIKNPENGVSMKANAILDDGANITTIDSKIARHLGLKGPVRRTEVDGFGGTTTSQIALRSKVLIGNINGRLNETGMVECVDAPCGDLDVVDWSQRKEAWNHLKDLPFNPPALGGKVDIILGIDFTFLHRSIKDYPPPLSVGKGPTGRLTPLGFTCIGRIYPADTMRTMMAIRKCTFKAIILPIDELFLKPTIPNDQDRKSFNKLKSETIHLPGGQVQAPCLWKSTSRPCNNYTQAKRDWERQRSRLKETNQTEVYHEAMSKLIDAGYLQKAADQDPGKGFYLSHFAIHKAESSSTRCRIVLNAKKTYNGAAMNDYLMSGPRLFNNLLTVLLKFRRFRYAALADVKQMFMRILLDPKDVEFHRILYSLPGMLAIIIYEFLCHVFGRKDAPAVAVGTLKTAALDMIEEEPEAAETVLDCSVIDDNLYSRETKQEMKVISNGIVKICSSIGMECHKCVSNAPEVLPEGCRLEQMANIGATAEDKLEDNQKALGLHWESYSDTLSFSYSTVALKEWTHLDLLKAYMGLFDPMGLILPFLMVARIIYRDLFKDPNGPANWNKKLSPELSKRWEKWLEELPLLNKVKIPRNMRLTKGSKLLVYSDASNDAAATVIYLMHPDGETIIVMAKGKVNADPSATINRLELAAAVLALEAAQQVWKALDMKPEDTTFYVDSTSVLYWLRNPGREIDRFVARRVELLRQGSLPETWQFVDTLRNPADIPSRGSTMRELLSSKLWWYGPDFVKTGINVPSFNIPAETRSPIEDEQSCRRMLAMMSMWPRPSKGDKIGDKITRESKPGYETFSRISEWSKILAVARQVRKACVIFQRRIQKPPTALLASEDSGKSLVIRVAQNGYYNKEMQALDGGEELPKKHDWNKFDLRFNSGALQMKGRSRQKWYYLLHKNMYVSQVWARHVHKYELAHCGGKMTLLARLRTWVWIFRGATLSAQTVRSCTFCRRVLPTRLLQKMSPLPEFRGGAADSTQCLGTFTTAIIDFAGPISTRQLRGRPKEKRYLLIFTCPTFRVVHVEFCVGMGTSDVIEAIQMFACRNGMPMQFISDNFSTFGAVARFLESQTKIKAPSGQISWSEVTWTFYQARAPHMGGAVERMVGCFKRALEKLLPGENYSDQELRAAAVFSEDLINRRPLHLVSNDTEDMEFLTPAHFKYGGNIGDFRCDENTLTTLQDHWFAMNVFRARIWKQFCAEVLVNLESRAKWNSAIPSLKEGDIMICMDGDLTPAGQWPLGRIVSAKPGLDGLVRSVEIRINGKVLTRHTKSLCPLFESDQGAGEQKEVKQSSEEVLLVRNEL